MQLRDVITIDNYNKTELRRSYNRRLTDTISIAKNHDTNNTQIKFIQKLEYFQTSAIK